MKKLKLDLDDLRVDSFSATPVRPRAGTVAARELDTDVCYTMDELCFFDDGYGTGQNTVGTCIGPTYCCPVTWKQTCLSCEGTCGASCGGTCVYTCRPDDVCSL
jgi:hypothetical protein